MTLIATLMVAQSYAFPVYDTPVVGWAGSSYQIVEMLTSPKVRQELAVTSQQFSGMKKTIGDAVVWRGDEVRLFNFGEDRDYTAMELKLVQVLTDTQRKRLSELWLQRQGIWAIERPSIMEALKLSRKQMHDVFDVAMDVREQDPGMAAAVNSSVNKRHYALLNKSAKRLTAVLTPSQLKSFHAMQGKPFDWGRGSYFRVVAMR